MEKLNVFNVKARSIKTIHAGDELGFYRFFSNENVKYSARALGKTSLLGISYEEFMEVIKNHPNDYEKFCVILL
jgi:hypothetical protein